MGSRLSVPFRSGRKRQEPRMHKSQEPQEPRTQPQQPSPPNPTEGEEHDHRGQQGQEHEQEQEQPRRRWRQQQPLQVQKPLQQQQEPPARDDDIAIIGMSCRFPGSADCPEGLWDMLIRGESSWTEFPPDRIRIDAFYHPSEARQGTISFRGGHFLRGNVAAFDASFFAISTDEARAIDPQQRFLLEVSYEALESAGIRKEDMDGRDASVFVGSFVKDYEQICCRDTDNQPRYAATGNGTAIMANRLSYFYNLHGPSMTIDTGCSASLVSLHQAAETLRNGQASIALAAGAGIILTPNTMMPMAAIGFLSKDSKCFTFDARANGYGRGEGIGVVVMKRLADAVRDGDPIRAVIRASRVNQDGRTAGITQPSVDAQVANIRDIYAGAGLAFDQTAYVECHGTGTQAGDVAELTAIARSLAQGRHPDHPLIVGSLKPNIGHLEGAAGVAGIIKAVMVLERGIIPQNINFSVGNPAVKFAEWGLKVPTEPIMAWPMQGSGPRRVSVNCFGFGGTNAHVILDQAPPATAIATSIATAATITTTPTASTTTTVVATTKVTSRRRNINSSNRRDSSSSINAESETKSSCSIKPGSETESSGSGSDGSGRDDRPFLFTYSAHSRAVLRKMLENHGRYVAGASQTAGLEPELDFLRSYSFTLTCRRSVLEWRASVVAGSVPELLEGLRQQQQPSGTATAPQPINQPCRRRPKICFVFCGQGAQFARMLMDLRAYPTFDQSLRDAARFACSIGCRFDLVAELERPEGATAINEPDVAQLAMTAVQVAVVDLLKALAITPACVVGHSSGEIAAAYAAGMMDRETAWAVAYERGRAAKKMLLLLRSGGGIAMGMLAARLSHAEAQARIRGSQVQVACINSPTWTVVAGPDRDLVRIEGELKAEGVSAVRLPVEMPYHSSHMGPAAAEYASRVAAHYDGQAHGPKAGASVEFHTRTRRPCPSSFPSSSSSPSSSSYSPSSSTTSSSSFWSRLLAPIVLGRERSALEPEKKANTKTTILAPLSAAPPPLLAPLAPMAALGPPTSQPQPRGAIMFSSVTGQSVVAPSLDPTYWALNMTSPVRFLDAIKSMNQDLAHGNPHLIIEVSPKPTLKGHIADILNGTTQVSIAPISQLRITQTRSLLEIVGRCWALGMPTRMSGLAAEESQSPLNVRVLTGLPAYPWDHGKTFWHEAAMSRFDRQRDQPRRDLLGAPAHDSSAYEPRWHGFLRVAENPWLRDHQVQGAIVYPAAGIISTVLEAGRDLVAMSSWCDGNNVTILGYEILGLRILRAIIVPDTAGGVEFSLHMQHQIGSLCAGQVDDPTRGHYDFTIYTTSQDSDGTAVARNATGRLRVLARRRHPNEHDSPAPASLFPMLPKWYCKTVANCHESVEPRQLYEHVNVVGLNYGPTFRNVTSMRRCAGACMFSVSIPDTLSVMPAGFEYTHLLHPATLDAMFHPLFAIKGALGNGPALPASVDRIFVAATLLNGPGPAFTGYATAGKVGLRDISANIAVVEDCGMLASRGSCFDDGRDYAKPAVIIEGLRLTDISSGSAGSSLMPSGCAKFLPSHRHLCTEIKWDADIEFATPDSLAQLLHLMCHKTPNLSVLQVGGNSVATCIRVVDLVSCLRHQLGQNRAHLTRYTFTGPGGPDLFTEACEKHGVDLVVEYCDLPLPPTSASSAVPGDDQDFPRYDLVVTGQTDLVPTGISWLQRYGGLFVIAKLDEPDQDMDKVIGTALPPTTKVWKTTDGFLILRQCRPLDPIAMPDVGVRIIDVIWPRRAEGSTPSKALWLVNFMANLADHIRSEARVQLRRTSLLEYGTVPITDGRPCISLIELGRRPDAVHSWSKEEFEAFHQLQKSTGQILWLTRSGQMADLQNPRAAAFVGLARTLMSENAMKQYVTLDIGTHTSVDRHLAGLVWSLFRAKFLEKPMPTGPRPDTEYAERKGRLYVPRLVPVVGLNRIIEGRERAGAGESEVHEERLFGNTHSHNEQALVLQVSKPGLVRDWFAFVPHRQSVADPLRDRQVELRPFATVLHRADYQTAMGCTAGQTLGVDICGYVARTGPSCEADLVHKVTAYLPGGGAVANRVLLSDCVLARPAIPSPDDPYFGMIVPSCHIAAYYGLVRVGELRDSSRPTVLIHAGASAHGQAAVMVAQLMGATIIATVLDPNRAEQRRHLVRDRGLDPSMVLNADDEALSAQVIALLGGRGVDVVYDPTISCGWLMEASVRCVRKSGRIVQLASKVFVPDAAEPAPVATASVIEVDLERIWLEKPGLIGKMYQSVWELFNAAPRANMPLPIRFRKYSMPVDLANALRSVKQNPFLGMALLVVDKKMSAPVLRMVDDQHAPSHVPRSQDSADHMPDCSRGIYILAGGWGGLGISVARLLVKRGARNIAFISRSGPTSLEAEALVEDLTSCGIMVQDYRVDLCDLNALRGTVDGIAVGLKILGVVQCAAVLCDAVFDNMTYENWKAGFDTKAIGSWNLVRCLDEGSHQPWVVFLSSASGVIGNRGQANYAAGNSVQDAMAAYWRNGGVCPPRCRRGVSLNLGPILGAGMLDRDEQLLDVLRATGFFGIRHSDFLTVLTQAIRGQTPTQVVTGLGTGGLLAQNRPADPFWARPALYRVLAGLDVPPACPLNEVNPAGDAPQSGASDQLRDRLASCDSRADAVVLIRDGLIAVLARRMNMVAADLDPSRDPSSFGADSLVAVVVRSWLVAETGVGLSVLEMLGGQSVTELATTIAQRGGFGEEAEE